MARTAGKRDGGSGSPSRMARSLRAQWSTRPHRHHGAEQDQARPPWPRAGPAGAARGRNAATASPPPTSASPVRIQARKVRSLASENR